MLYYNKEKDYLGSESILQDRTLTGYHAQNKIIKKTYKNKHFCELLLYTL